MNSSRKKYLLKQSLLVLPVLVLALAAIIGANQSVTQIVVNELDTGADTSLYKAFEISLDEGDKHVHVFPKLASAFILEFENLTPKPVNIELIGQKSYELQALGSDPEGRFFSSLVIPNELFRSIRISSGTKGTTKVKIHTLFVPGLGDVVANQPKLQKNFTLCETPDWISYETWRKGLPDPLSGRVTSDVKHCVVHHSAVNSSDTDYVKRVRNIYVFHTQTRGWDDIGYNFLIAPNGQLFAGRDPQGSGAQDDVMGAHYCGKNTGTMGICMMGDFTDSTVTDTAKGTLKHVLVWKLYKSGLSTKDVFRHPLGTGDYLKTIVGHRDGCATACPGASFYPEFSKLRTAVQTSLDQCIIANAAAGENVSERTLIWPNPSTNFIRVSHSGILRNHPFVIRDLKGNVVQTGTLNVSRKIEVGELSNGNYILQLKELPPVRFIKTFN